MKPICVKFTNMYLCGFQSCVVPPLERADFKVSYMRMKRKFRISSVLLTSLYLSAVVFLSGCKKDPVLPTISTVAPAEVTSTSAVAGGNVLSDGRAAITERGICWSESANPTVDDNKKIVNESGTGVFSVDITGLMKATTYHVRAFAVNSVGISYGEDLQFTTLATPPAISTWAIGEISWTTATSGGSGLSDGGSDITAKGICWSTSSGPVVSGQHTVDGTGPGDFVSSLTDLTPNTLYYVRSYATNSQGTTYGNEVSFRTLQVVVPSLTTNAATGITLTEAVSGGNSISENGAAVLEKGICWNTTGNPTTSGPHASSGTGTGNFTVNIDELSPSTVYYVRAYARNSAGIGYGSEVAFSTDATDIDGNIYNTIIIGTQVWMQEDLRTTRYPGGNEIPFVTDSTAWKNLTTPACCWYDNIPQGDGFGLIYNWYTIEVGELCPDGWHVPTDEEFKILERYLGMTTAESNKTEWRGTDEGNKLKSTTSWDQANGTNSSGFTALGEGYRYGVYGKFYNFGKVGYWWTSSYHWDGTTKALYRRLDSNEGRIYREGVIKAGGKSVRCLKN
jgi:uncharacterized protein (TIGR02145 family)